jgi:hypothetical protein
VGVADVGVADVGVAEGAVATGKNVKKGKKGRMVGVRRSERNNTVRLEAIFQKLMYDN